MKNTLEQERKEKHETSNIQFKINSKGLTVSIETTRLRMSSTKREDIENYYNHLFGNQEVMQNFMSGNTWSKESVAGLTEQWVEKWESNNPFSALTVSNKDNNDFIGVVGLNSALLSESGLENSTYRNTVELFYCYKKDSWGKGYGFEAGNVIGNDFLKTLAQKEYPIIKKNGTKEPLLYLYATAHPKNPGSCKILEKIGMKLQKTEKMYGTERNIYTKKI